MQASNCFVRECSRRGRRYPAGAHTVTVALRADSAAVLALGSHRGTRFVRCAHAARTTAMSMTTKRAARADPKAVLLAATEIAPAGYRLPRRSCAVGIRCEYQRPRCNEAVWLAFPCRKYPPPVHKAALGWAAVRLCDAEEHSLHGRARSALRKHSHRGCPSGESEANAASSAMGHATAHRREVDTKCDRRSEAPQHTRAQLCGVDRRVKNAD